MTMTSPHLMMTVGRQFYWLCRKTRGRGKIFVGGWMVALSEEVRSDERGN